MQVLIQNTEPADSNAVLEVTVVTVGDLTAAEQRHHLKAGDSVNVAVNPGQFVMVDELDFEEK